MRRKTCSTAFLALACAFAQWAPAQTVYKCGEAYSQTPCPGGVPLSVDDSRSAAQKAQSQAVARQDARTAEQMRRDRQAQEKLDLAANRALPPGKVAAQVASAPRPASSNAKLKPGEFTADVPTEKTDKAAKRKQHAAAPLKKKSPTADQPVRK